MLPFPQAPTWAARYVNTVLFFACFLLCIHQLEAAGPIWGSAGNTSSWANPYSGPVSMPMVSWSITLPDCTAARVATAINTNGLLYCGCDGTLSAINGTTGAVAWKYQPSFPAGYISSVVVDDMGTVFVAYNGGGAPAAARNGLYAFNGTTGNHTWFVNIPADTLALAPDDQGIVVSSWSQGVRRVSTSGRAVVWTAPMPGTTIWTVVITPDGYIMAVAANKIFGLDKKTGNVSWTVMSSGSPCNGFYKEDYPSVGSVGGGVFYWGDSCYLYCTNSSSGVQVWSQKELYSYTLPITVDSKTGLIYYADKGSNAVIALNQSTAQRIWAANTLAQVSTPISIGGGVAYTTDASWTVHALNISSGKRLWKLAIDGDPAGSAIVDVSGSVYVPFRNGATTAIAALAVCPPGFSCSDGIATACMRGTYSLRGWSRCDQCPVATYQQFPAQSTCTSCDVGTYAAFAGQSECTPCPVGRVGLLGGQSNVSSCQPCPMGTYNMFSGQAGYESCRYCSAGYYADESGLVVCKPCPTGTYNDRAGAQSLEACLPCPQGTYNPFVGQLSFGCQKCAPGTNASAWGANTSVVCENCPAGYFSSSGSSVCEVCPAGTFSSSSGAALCTLCGRGSYSSSVGAISEQTCISCPQGSTTAFPGSVVLSACIANVLSCPAGMQAPSRTPLTNLSACVPLECAGSLAYSSGNGCSGCPAGSAGMYPYCYPCAGEGALCPGFLLAPLVPLEVVGQRNGWQSPPSCITNLKGPEVQETAETQHVVGVVATGVLVAAATIATTVWLFAFQSSTAWVQGWQTRGRRLLVAADSVWMANPTNDGEAIVKRMTPLGGLSSLLGSIAILTLASVAFIQRSYNNQLVQQSVVLSTSTMKDEFGSLAWANGVNNWSPGIHIRIVAQAAYCDSIISTGATGIEGSGTFVLAQQSQGCTAENLSEYLLSCEHCEVTQTSAIYIDLPYSCQTLFVQAISVQADGALSVASLPLDATVAAGESLLSSVQWTLGSAMDTRTDNIAGATQRGYRLINTGHRTLYTPTSSVANSFLPLQQSVQVSVSFAVQSMSVRTTISQLTSPLQFMSSVLALGAVMGVMAQIFGCIQGARSARWERLNSCCNIILHRSHRNLPMPSSSHKLVVTNPIATVSSPLPTGNRSQRVAQLVTKGSA